MTPVPIPEPALIAVAVVMAVLGASAYFTRRL